MFFLVAACLSILAYLIFSYNPQKKDLNLLILGESGPGHAGSLLTDTMIFSSISSKGTVLISVPRDLWYTPWQVKINALYYYGQQQGDGLGKTKEILGEILGQKIEYGMIVDFDVFKDLVNLVGGIDVKIDRSFDDFKYPIAGKENDLCDGDPEYKCRYEHLRFEAGLQHLNGDRALMFVRSRNAEGDEGTDTARSFRQQKVIAALKKKLTSPRVFLSPWKIKGLIDIFNRRVKTDIPRNELLVLVRLLLHSQARQFQSFVLDGWQAEGPLYHPQKHSSGQWVLLPRDPSLEKLHQFIGCLIGQEDKSVCRPD